MTTEEWRPVPGFEGLYEVSDAGQVRSLTRNTEFRVGQFGVIQGRELSLSRSSKGHYWRVGLSVDGFRRGFFVHRLVAAAFHGPLPEGQEVRHLDGDPGNNHVSNLAYGTHSENVRDSVAHGTHPGTRKTHCKFGHPFSPENTRTNHLGGRECRTCRSEQNRRINERRFAERAARGRSQYLRVAGEDVLTAVRELYATTRLTQAEIADRLGIAQSTVSRWVRGETRPDIPGPITKRGKGGRAA